MPARTIIVVGRPFARFAALVGGLTPDTALTALRDRTLGPAHLVLGQGVTAEEWSDIEAAGAGAVTADPFPRREPVRVGVHQRDPRNVLIADLEPVKERRWRAAVVIHPESAPLADRDNGTAHVPGMVEVEAGLQTAMAVAEQYLLPRPGAFDFTSSRVEIAFETFMFPLPAAVELHADHVAWPSPEVLELDATAEIHQGGRRVMTMRFRSQAFERGLLAGLESERADEVLPRPTDPTFLEQR
jgi:hypothetical protein